MAIIEIKNRWYGKVLYRGEHESLKEVVEALKNSTSHLPYGDLLDNISLAHANLSGADLSGADLSGADLSGADLSGTNLSDADLADAEQAGAKIG